MPIFQWTQRTSKDYKEARKCDSGQQSREKSVNENSSNSGITKKHKNNADKICMRIYQIL